VHVHRVASAKPRKQRWGGLGRSLAGLPFLALAVLLPAAGCGGGGAGPAEESQPHLTPLVEAVQARSGTLPLEERLSGIVKARNQVAIRAEISARVVEVPLRSGQAVERGQVLVRLDDGSYRDQLRQAEASVRLAEAEARQSKARVAELRAQVVRSRTMAEQALISDLELETQEARLAAAEAGADQAEARVEQARASVEERRTALERCEIRAPVSGRVGQRLAEVGMLTTPGTVLFVLGDLDELMVEIPLTERMLAYVREGQTVRVSATALGDEPIEANLSRISPFLEEQSFSTIGEIELRNRDDRLRPGMFVTVDVLYGESEEATLIPTSALWEQPRTGELGVYVVAPAKSGQVLPTAAGDTGPDEARVATFRGVEVLAEGRLSVGVRGVEVGDWVVTLGQNLLRGDAPSPVRMRPASWERVVALQKLQREDLLERFLEKQQHLAETIGAEPPPLTAEPGPQADNRSATL